MNTAQIKQQAHALIDQLPDDTSWDDIVYEMAVRREIEAGLADSEAHRLVPVEELIKRFNLPE
jgi:hypothetical protein